jgi:hypothetical protein
VENGENQERGVSMKIRGVGRFSVPGVCFGSFERSLERFSGVGFGTSRLFHAHKKVSEAPLLGALSALGIRLFDIATLFHPFSSCVPTRLQIHLPACLCRFLREVKKFCGTIFATVMIACWAL